jgi:uncharacterized surface protein with fasciclin (FAS1) repeats
MMKRIIIIFIISLLSTACNTGSREKLSSPSDFEDNTPKGQASVVDNVSDKNILQIAMESEIHSTLIAAVQAAEIEHVLVNAGPLTVFAPTNAAFDALPDGTIESLLKPENKEKLALILKNHAAPGSFNLESLKKEALKGRKIYTAAGDYLEIDVKEKNISVGGAQILSTLKTSNGIINVVDKIILPVEK